MHKPMSDHCDGCPFWDKIDCSFICIAHDVPGVWRRINNVYGDEPIEDLEIYASRAEYFQEELKAINNYENRLKNEILNSLQYDYHTIEERKVLVEMLQKIERAAYETGKEYTG